MVGVSTSNHYLVKDFLPAANGAVSSFVSLLSQVSDITWPKLNIFVIRCLSSTFFYFSPHSKWDVKKCREKRLASATNSRSCDDLQPPRTRTHTMLWKSPWKFPMGKSPILPQTSVCAGCHGNCRLPELVNRLRSIQEIKWAERAITPGHTNWSLTSHPGGWRRTTCNWERARELSNHASTHK